MKRYLSVFLLLSVINSFAQERFQLARPLVKYESVFFSDQAKFEMKFAHPGAAIYFTLDNNIPPGNPAEPSPKNLRYKRPLFFTNQFTTVRAKVFCKGFDPSETITLSFARDGKTIKKVTGTSPHSTYPGSGDSTLFDNRGGLENISSGTWMGYNCDSVRFTVELEKNQPVSSVLLSFLQQEASWIFLPELITIYYFDDSRETYLPFGREVIFSEKQSDKKVNFRIISGDAGGVKTQKLFIDIRTVKSMPDWHPAKGEHAWCFIDEIKVY